MCSRIAGHRVLVLVLDGFVLLCCIVQHTKECLAKIGIEAEGHDGEHGQDAIFRLIAAIMHLLNVGFKSGEDLTMLSLN